MGHIFISYSHKDKEYVHRLQKALQYEGFDVWIDDRIDYGTTWPTVIQRNLDTCSAFVIVMSENAYESRWVHNEVTRAERKKKPFFVLLLSGDTWLNFEAVQYENVIGGKLPPAKFFESLGRVVPRKEEKRIEREGNQPSTNVPSKLETLMTTLKSAIKGTFSRFFDNYLAKIPSLVAKFPKRILLVIFVTLFTAFAGIALYTQLGDPPLYFSGISGGDVNVYSYKDNTVTQITRTVGGGRNWSPVSDLSGGIFFTSNRTGKAEIFSFNTNTGKLWQVTDTPGQAESWSPAMGGSAEIYFVSNRTGKAEIFGFNTNTGKLWQITNTPGQAESWSPTKSWGANVYFTSTRTGRKEIFGFNTNTGELWQITKTPGQAESWSPASGFGGDIYFTSDRTGKKEIFGFNTSTGKLWQVTNTPGQAGSWAPVVLGKKIYFTSDRSGSMRIYLLATNGIAITDFGSWTKQLVDQSPNN